MRHFFLGSVRRQLITGVTLVHAVLMTVFVYDLVLRQEKMLVENHVEHALALVQTLAISSAEWLAAYDIMGLEEILQAQQKNPELTFALLTNRDGVVVSHTDRQKLGLKVVDLPATPQLEIISKTNQLVDVATPVMLAGRQVGWARIGIGAHATRQKMAAVTRDGVLYAVIAIAAGAMIAWVMGCKITDRLYAIQHTIDAIKAGSHASRTRLSGTDEAAILAGEFDAMLDALAQRDAKLQQHADTLGKTNLNLEKIVQERTQQVRTSLAQVEKRESELKMAQNVARIGSWRLDVANDGLTCSDETYAIFGIEVGTPPTLEGFTACIHPDDRERVLAAWTAALAGKPYDIEHRIRVGGQIKWVHEKAQMQFDEDGRALSGIGTVQDITERKKSEQELNSTLKSLAKSNQELEHFAYIASHDLQEPLRKVGSYMELVSERYREQLDQDAREFIDYAVDGARRMKIMIDDLLVYSRVGTKGKTFASVDLMKVMQVVLDDLELAIQDTHAVVSHDVLPVVTADDTQLQQLFRNLIGNALKYRGEDPPQIRVWAERQVQTWRICVQDNGIGIDPRFSERIFQIFQRLHPRGQYDGTGIGLAVCKKIVERHGGDIGVVSEPGQGSTFYFTVPDQKEDV